MNRLPRKRSLPTNTTRTSTSWSLVSYSLHCEKPAIEYARILVLGGASRKKEAYRFSRAPPVPLNLGRENFHRTVMRMKLVSVNVGLPREVIWHGMNVTTGIFKEPVTGRVRLHTLNL